MATRNLRWRAFKMGINLILAATNPWSAPPSQSSEKNPLEPPSSYPFPEWLLVPGLQGRVLNLDDLVMLKRAALGKRYQELSEAQPAEADL